MSRRHRRWPRTVAFVAFVAAAGVGWAIYALHVSEVRVVGVSTLSPNDIITAANIRGGERILWTQMSRIARRVEAVPGVASARADRSLPATVVIRVTERVPVVRLDRHPGLVADPDGVIFPYERERALPVLVGWSGRAQPGARVDGLSRLVLGAIAGLPQSVRDGAQRIEVGRSVGLFLADGTEIRFGPPTDLDAKVRAALAVLDVAAARGEELAYVDVRAPNAPASRPRAPGPGPSPAASPAP